MSLVNNCPAQTKLLAEGFVLIPYYLYERKCRFSYKVLVTRISIKSVNDTKSVHTVNIPEYFRRKTMTTVNAYIIYVVQILFDSTTVTLFRNVIYTADRLTY